MALCVAWPVDVLERQMAGLTYVPNGKRKASSPLPTGAQIIDLTSDNDDDIAPPIAKRQKSHPIEEDRNALSSQARDTVPFEAQQHRQQDLIESHAAQIVPAANKKPLSDLSSPRWQQPPISSQTSRTFQDALEDIQYQGKAPVVNGSSRPKPLGGLKPPFFSVVAERPTVSKSRSDSEVFLQNFLVPQATPIKFEADAVPTSTTSAEIGSGRKLLSHDSHQKNRSFDQTDVEKVGSFFPSSSRPTAITNKLNASQFLRVDNPQQWQPRRESRVPERPFQEKAQPLKAIGLPSRTATPRIEAHRQVTPPRSQISVVIPTSQTKTKQHLLNHEEDQARKKSLLRDMKRDVAVVRERAASVEQHFGTTGFSKIYGTASDVARVKEIHKLQLKEKKVRRRDIRLDWGTPKPTTPFHPKSLVHPRDQIKSIARITIGLAAALSSSSTPPITFVNDINDRQLNGKFQFISEYVTREGVKRQPAHQHAHVNCSGTCCGSCTPSSCSCLRNNNMDHTDTAYTPTYSRRPDGLIVLSNVFMSKKDGLKPEIRECNKNCLCDTGCYNRLVQRGRTLPLEIFMTQTCGFGLRCPQNIVKGQFIDVYLGEVVTESMLVQREEAQEEGEPSYLFSLDWFNTDRNNDVDKSKVFYQIDGANFGTPMRFVNHSCSANCGVFPVMLNDYDQKIYGLAVFALEDIPAMQELTLDYAPVPDLEEEEEDLEAKRVRCLCREDACRGWLWPKHTKRARRKRILRG